MLPAEEESITRRIRLVGELVWSSLPGAWPESADNRERWEHLTGPALLAKAMTTAESMALLMPTRNAVDALVLLRVLYENVVNLAWIAANPTYRLNRLYSEFHHWHLKENTDWAKAGLPILSSEEVTESEDGPIIPNGCQPSPREAVVADKHWGRDWRAGTTLGRTLPTH